MDRDLNGICARLRSEGAPCKFSVHGGRPRRLDKGKNRARDDKFIFLSGGCPTQQASAHLVYSVDPTVGREPGCDYEQGV